MAELINVDAILSQWQAIENWFAVKEHTFPVPVWRQHGFEHDSSEAWAQVTQRIQHDTTYGPISVYVHVPFCERRCGFCDLLAHPLPKSQQHREKGFAETLCKEIGLWASLLGLSERPVTTIHFGGGTPNCLSPSVLSQIVGAYQDQFHMTSKTEWALESTSRLLTHEHVTELKAMGFSRLHVGVQTLNDSIRRRIGRKESRDMVLARLHEALAQDLVVSVDVLYGLPGQGVKDLINTLERLVAVGVHGFSLYKLQVCDRNRAFLERIGAGHADPLLYYVLYQVAEQFLRNHGYRKNFFTHFALPQDKCLYYHHVKRGENLLAMGPTADGVFGDYLYRHLDYPEYVQAPVPALEGGVTETPHEQALRPVVAALMTCVVTSEDLARLQSLPLLDLWRACELLSPGESPKTFELTANGSWFITQMIRQLHHRVTQSIT